MNRVKRLATNLIDTISYKFGDVFSINGERTEIIKAIERAVAAQQAMLTPSQIAIDTHTVGNMSYAQEIGRSTEEYIFNTRSSWATENFLFEQMKDMVKRLGKGYGLIRLGTDEGMKILEQGAFTATPDFAIVSNCPANNHLAEKYAKEVAQEVQAGNYEKVVHFIEMKTFFTNSRTFDPKPSKWTSCPRASAKLLYLVFSINKDTTTSSQKDASVSFSSFPKLIAANNNPPAPHRIYGKKLTYSFTHDDADKAKVGPVYTLTDFLFYGRNLDKTFPSAAVTGSPHPFAFLP